MIFLAELLEPIGQKLNETGVWVSILPFALGIFVKTLSPFVLSEEKTKTQILSSIEIHKEKICVSIHRLIKKALYNSSHLDDDLRGDENEDPPKPDLIAQYYEEVAAAHSDIKCLESIRLRTKRVYSVIVATIIIALFATVIGLTVSSWRAVITIMAISLLVIQVVMFIILRRTKNQIENYE